MKVTLVANGDPSWEPVAESVLDSVLAGEVELAGQNVASFDLPVMAIHFPRLLSKTWAVVASGRVRDSLFREQLLNLALHGYVDVFWLPDGVTKKDVSYRLEDLVRKHLGIEMQGKGRKSAKKEEDLGLREDVWQLHFDTLDGLPSSHYPREAYDYVLSDADLALRVCEQQDLVAYREFTQNNARDKKGQPFDVFKTEWLHCRAAFALAHMTYVGFGVDHAEVLKMKTQVEDALRPEQMEVLFESKILRRPEKPRQLGSRMTKGRKSSKNMKRLLEIVLEVWNKNALCDEEGCKNFNQTCEDHGLPPLRRTAPSKRFPKCPENPLGGQISCDGDTIALLSAFDERPSGNRLAAYECWQGLGKLKDLEIPVLESTDRIRGAYEIMKKTQRVSCRGSRNFPSRNLQQVPRGFDVDLLDENGKPVLDEKGKKKKVKIEPRRCYVAPFEGWLLISVDYAALELATLAQMAFETFGRSKLRDIINAGADPHAWLGAQLARGCDQQFAARCTGLDSDGVYALFKKFKRGSKDEQALFKKFRGLAKPTGLGLGGGMGAKRLMDYALGTFFVQIKTLEEAKQYKQIWLEAFPEMGEYLRKYVPNELVDEKHSKEDKPRFAYFSPLGTYRSCCTYTEAANGNGLQTRAAEGAKLAVFDVTRACWDPAMKSILYGARPLAFVHDEMIVAAPFDERFHDRAWEVSRLMCQAMQVVCPDMIIRAEPAAMKSWEKGAELVLGPDEKLRPWSPFETYATDDQGRFRSKT